MSMGLVLVTGGCGRVGRAAVKRLLADGRPVRVLDRLDETTARALPEAGDWAGAAYVRADINDYSDLLAKARGCATIVHLAALASPACASPDEIFRIDAAGTFNVFRVAEELGVRRVVQASSINALGHLFGTRPHEPVYFPIDEDHPTAASDAYSLAKRIGEEIGAYHWRRSGISSVALRFPMVLNPERTQWMAGWNNGTAERVLALPDGERRRWVATCRTAFDRLRATGLMEDPECWKKLAGDPPLADADTRWFIGARANFFAAVDDRDTTQAIIKGLDTDFAGAHPLFISQAVNTAHIDAERLAGAFFPDTTARRRALIGDEGLVGIDRARDLIGYAPAHRY